MSDTCLRLVPGDPFWRPRDEDVSGSLTIVRSLLPAADSVEFESEDGVTFFDAGGNTESVACPSCAADLDSWWGEAMGAAFESGFEDLTVTTPCCGRSTTLNDLVYVWPAAFGSCAITVRNPGVDSFEADRLAKVEQAIGAPLKLVWQRI